MLTESTDEAMLLIPHSKPFFKIGLLKDLELVGIWGMNEQSITIRGDDMEYRSRFFLILRPDDVAC